MDAVNNGLHGDDVDEDPGEAARIGDASTQASEAAASRDAIVEVTGMLMGDRERISTHDRVALVRAADALREAADATADAEDAVDDWLSSRTANDA